MNKKRILWITERYPPLTGGMSASCERQVYELRKRGYIIDVVLFLPSETKYNIEVFTRDNGNDFQVFYKNSFGNATQLAWAEILLQKEEYNIVLGFGINMPSYIATTFAKWLKIPSVISCRGNDFDRDLFEPKRAYFVDKAISNADLIIAVSKEKVEKIKSLYPNKKVEFSPNGIDVEHWDLFADELDKINNIKNELTDNGKRRVIGIFGELKFKKRIQMFLSVLRESGLINNVSLLIVGKMNTKLTLIVQDANLTPFVKHLSFKNRDDLPVYYGVCDYIAMPSLIEGFPNVLLEAMATSCIPIVSTAGAMDDIIENGKSGFTFAVEDRVEALQAIEAALNLSDKELISMKNEVKKRIKDNFTISKEIDMLEQFLGQ